ncbi:MAG: hypothetical protein NUV67_05895 [archaeon]|nr:hypothetical protein [archaeon]
MGVKYKYLVGACFASAYRLLRVFPNSDPLMGFIAPAAKNEPMWKAPLFAFATMFIFDFFTSGIGVWTWVTATTYALVALWLTHSLKGKKSSLSTYASHGAIGIIAFDIITGPFMSTFFFGTPFMLTTIAQVPFTIMHVISATFGIAIITPFYDSAVAKEISGYFSNAKATLANLRLVR